jgi:hypothetical protein
MSHPDYLTPDRKASITAYKLAQEMAAMGTDHLYAEMGTAPGGTPRYMAASAEWAKRMSAGIAKPARICAYQVNSTDTEGIEHAERWTNDEGTAWDVARKVLAKDDVVKVTVEKDMR